MTPEDRRNQLYRNLIIWFAVKLFLFWVLRKGIEMAYKRHIDSLITEQRKNPQWTNSSRPTYPPRPQENTNN